MNVKAVKKLRNALRSGEYKQGYNKCYSMATGKFCVLGVAERAVANTSLMVLFSIFSLSSSTAKKLGLDNRNPKLFGERLTTLNDGRRDAVTENYDGFSPLTFDEIADLLDIVLLEPNEGYLE